MGYIVAIVGRPNVGKSTLFNRLTGMRTAIVDETSGVTRDRIYGKCDWNGIEFSVVDTGGYVSNSGDIFEEEIKKQVNIAIEEADVILFLLDVETGITTQDEAITKLLRKCSKKVLPVINKVDNLQREFDTSAFYSLGMGSFFPVSAITGSGTGDLLDEVVKNFQNLTIEDDSEVPRIAIVGKPNVGKSSLINALVGENRNIVTPIPGTTRDSIYSRYSKFGFDFFLIDTAGLRKKSKVEEKIEFYSVLRSIRAIENADVCLLLLDATQGLEAQDMHIFGLIDKNHKGIVILVNKWDLVEKETKTADDYTDVIRKKIAPFSDVPVIFTSVINKQRIHKVLETAMTVYHNRKQRISTSVLNKIMLEAIQSYPPPAVKGKFVKIKYVTQLPGRYPSFAFFCNLPQYVNEPYKRYLENKLRENFNFSGVSVQIYMKKK